MPRVPGAGRDGPRVRSMDGSGDADRLARLEEEEALEAILGPECFQPIKGEEEEEEGAASKVGHGPDWSAGSCTGLLRGMLSSLLISWAGECRRHIMRIMPETG